MEKKRRAVLMNLNLMDNTNYLVNCVDFLSGMTDYTLEPEKFEHMAQRMSLEELQALCREKIDYARKKVERQQKEAEKKKKRPPYDQYQLNRMNNLFNKPLVTKQDCVEVLNYIRKSKLEEKSILDVYSMKKEQLIAMCLRIRKDIPKHIKEIMELEQELQVPNPHTKDQLEELTYNELTSIRNALKSQKKKGIKVVKVEPAPLPVIEEGLEAVRQDETDYFDSEDIHFLTPMEAYQMFGPDFQDYSEEELFRMGYKLEEGPYPKIEPDNSPFRNALKREIIKCIVCMTSRYTVEELRKKNLDQLKFIYETEAEQLRDAKTIEEIEEQIRLGKK